ncbi:cell division protein FtsK [Saccharopolyspora karakumensis]|uniref:Cell division protein FtsK n=1 Tax=Saccharopolyspora karakumensis TaxID=2530386 RepID=A0A4R5C6V5_9PSEU|nr:FtsK/SpoIIIE domain-containing protein [Saccharopolyspora karakumensis]TDD92734.1 cell division protein FtsK [Saccharopolyspora karakumensis]
MRDTRVGTERTPARVVGGWMLRHPRTMASTTAVGTAGVTLGYQTVLWAAGIAVLAGASWRLLDAPTFDRFAGRLLRAWWRRWVIYQRQWMRVVASCGLVTADHRGDSLVPKLVAVRSNWVWDSLHIRMAKGQEPEDYGQALDRLANSFKAHAASMRILQPGKIALDFQRREPFNEMVIPLPAMPESVDAVDLRKLEIGRTEFGRPFQLDLAKRDVHVLLAGETGAGKGSWLWGIQRALAPLIRAGHVRLWVIDPKGGMELGGGREMYHRFADSDRAGLALMREYVETLDERKFELGRQGIRNATPSRETPLDVLICDELAAMTAYTDRDIRVEFHQLLSKGLTQFRAVGGRIIAATQEPTKDVVPMRGLFPTKIALRVDAASYVDMCLGEGMRDLGAFADKIPTYLAGVAYAKNDGRKEPQRVRAAFSTDDDIAELVAFCTELSNVTPIRKEIELPDGTFTNPYEVDFEDFEDDELEEIEHFEGDDEDDEEIA